MTLAYPLWVTLKLFIHWFRGALRSAALQLPEAYRRLWEPKLHAFAFSACGIVPKIYVGQDSGLKRPSKGVMRLIMRNLRNLRVWTELRQIQFAEY